MSPPSPQSDIILKIYTNILYSTLPGTITHLFKLIKRISFSYRQKKSIWNAPTFNQRAFLMLLSKSPGNMPVGRVMQCQGRFPHSGGRGCTLQTSSYPRLPSLQLHSSQAPAGKRSFCECILAATWVLSVKFWKCRNKHCKSQLSSSISSMAKGLIHL